ncbi:unnamed protein product [Phaeothamnion confervicola]
MARTALLVLTASAVFLGDASPPLSGGFKHSRTGIQSTVTWSNQTRNVDELTRNFLFKGGRRGEEDEISLRFTTRVDFFQNFRGKWLAFFGDSNTRFMVLSLLQMLDIEGIRGQANLTATDPCEWWAPEQAVAFVDDCLRVGEAAYVWTHGGDNRTFRFVREVYKNTTGMHPESIAGTVQVIQNTANTNVYPGSMAGTMEAARSWRRALERDPSAVLLSYVMTTETSTVESVVGRPGRGWIRDFGGSQPDAYFFATGAWDRQVMRQYPDRLVRAPASSHPADPPEGSACGSTVPVGSSNVSMEDVLADHRGYISRFVADADGNRRPGVPVIWGLPNFEPRDPAPVRRGCALFEIQRRVMAPGLAAAAGVKTPITGLMDRYGLTKQLPEERLSGPHFTHIVNTISMQGVLQLFRAHGAAAESSAARASPAAAATAATAAAAVAQAGMISTIVRPAVTPPLREPGSQTPAAVPLTAAGPTTTTAVTPPFTPQEAPVQHVRFADECTDEPSPPGWMSGLRRVCRWELEPTAATTRPLATHHG